MKLKFTQFVIQRETHQREDDVVRLFSKYCCIHA